MTDLTDLDILPLESTPHPELKAPTDRTESRDAIASKKALQLNLELGVVVEKKMILARCNHGWWTFGF